MPTDGVRTELVCVCTPMEPGLPSWTADPPLLQRWAGALPHPVHSTPTDGLKDTNSHNLWIPSLPGWDSSWSLLEEHTVLLCT